MVMPWEEVYDEPPVVAEELPLEGVISEPVPVAPGVAAEAPVAEVPADAMPWEEYAPAPEVDVPQDDAGMMAQIGEMFTGSQEMTPEIEGLSEIGEAPELAEFGNVNAWKAALGLMTSGDPEKLKNVLKAQFPGTEFETDSKGNTIVKMKSGNYVLNLPGMSGQDVVKGVFDLLAFTPAGRTTAATTGLGAKLGVGAATSMGTTEALETTAGLLGDQGIVEAALDVPPGELALSGALGGAGELLTAGIPALRNYFRKVPEDLAELDQVAIGAVEDAAARTGIDIFEPQAVGSKADLNTMEALQDLPQTTQKMMQMLRRQNEQAHTATADFLADVAPIKSIETGSRAVRDAAADAIESMKLARSDLVEGQYARAFDEALPVDTTELMAGIKDISKAHPKSSPTIKLLNRVKTLIKDSGDDLRKLHSTKLALDDLISGASDTPVGRNARRELLLVKSMLLDTMEEASPNYLVAKDLYQNASGPINQMENSLIGKIASIDDVNLKRVATTLFDQAESNPAVLASAKKIIMKQDKDAWAAINRVGMEQRLGKMSIRAIEGAPNAPAALRQALFGKNEIQNKMIMNAMTPTQRKNAQWMDIALKAAARGRLQGSPTAGRQEAISGIKGKIASHWNKLFSPKETITRFVNDKAFDINANSLVDLMMSGKWSAEMAKLTKLNPKGEAGVLALLNAVNRANTDEE